jgi:voltage-gated potassium channel
MAQQPTAPAPQSASPDARRDLGIPASGWRRKLFIVVFEADTRAGRLFDLLLIGVILASVIVVVLDSMRPIGAAHRTAFEVMEWCFTLIFTVEYVLRLACVERPLRYAISLFGIIDLVAVLPTYLAFFFPDLHALIDVRILRLLRIFRILKMGAYIAEYSALGRALAASRRKIFIFLSFVVMVVLVMGTLIYVIEGP